MGRLTEGTSGRWTTRPSGLVVLALLLPIAVGLLLGRQVATAAWDTVWAEDGAIFLSDALTAPVGSLFTAYGGYVHPVPRVVATVASWLPLDHAAFVFALAWALVVSLLALFVYFASSEVLRARPLRLALGVLVLLLPAAGSELLGNATNLHFYLIHACFWAFVWRSEARTALAARATVAGATALSDPLAILFGPLALWGVVERRTRRALVVPAALAAGLAVQFAAILAGVAPQRLTRFDAGDLVPLFALRVTGSLLVGDRFIDELWFALGRAFAFGALTAVGLALLVGAARSRRATRAFVAVSSFYAVAFFGVQLFGRGTAGMRPGEDEATWHLAGARFTYAPILFLSAALLAVLDDVSARLQRPVRQGVGPVALLLVVALVAANYPLKSERSLGPRWTGELAEARGRCARGAEEVRVLVAPAPFQFSLTVPCARLE
jgi:hypothetical protein